MNDIFTTNKYLLFTVALLTAAVGYWQGIHVETWTQIFTFENTIGLVLVLAGVVTGNHASSVWLNTGNTPTVNKPTVPNTSKPEPFQPPEVK
jgi:hypothetical protein